MRLRETSIHMVGNMRWGSDLPGTIHLRPDLRGSGHVFTNMWQPAYLQWRRRGVSGSAPH